MTKTWKKKNLSLPKQKDFALWRIIVVDKEWSKNWYKDTFQFDRGILNDSRDPSLYTVFWIQSLFEKWLMIFFDFLVKKTCMYALIIYNH